VSDRTYKRVHAFLGDKGMVELVGICGYYALISMTLNVFRAQIPGTRPCPSANRLSGAMPEDIRPVLGYQTYQFVGLLLGPSLFVLLLMLPAPSGLSPAAWATAAVAVWMAIWWATEALPLAATALLPLVLMPLLGISNVQQAAAPFANPLIYLFLGGFLIALAVQRWGLHRRIALHIVVRVGREAAQSDRGRHDRDRAVEHVDQQHGDRDDDAADRRLAGRDRAAKHRPDRR
jgi:hypothetical protein